MNFRNIFKKLKDPIIRARIDNEYGIGKLESLFFKNWFNPFATIWVNFRSFPFRQAIKFPFWAYGRPRFYSLSGKMKIEGKVRPGMIKFNMVKSGAPGNMAVQSEIQNLGEIIFKGTCQIGTGNKIVVSYNAILCLGNHSVIMDNCFIGCHVRIDIGENSRFANRCQIMDTDYHFIADLNRQTISPRHKPIVIGDSCWVCSAASILKGTKLPDYTIIGSNSAVNKDFSEIKNGCLIAGAPAKVLRTGVVRLFNPKIEKEIWKFWHQHPSETFPIRNYSLQELADYR